MTDSKSKVDPAAKDFLFLQLRDLPYFRAFLRAVESSFYQGLSLPEPVYDVGCGDGHFASLTFERKIDVGLDPWHAPIHEAKKHGAYRSLVEADAAHAPFPDHYFASGFSNSVLEHIPHIEAVLAETARVLKPGAPFVFCVPNDNFLPSLSIGGGFDRMGLHQMASWYRSFFNKISRHYHCDSPSVWQARLEQNGFTLERWWHYFSPQALHVLEWGHYFGAPTLIPHALFNRWIMAPTRWNLYFTERFLRKFMESPEHPQGVYTFYIAHVSTGGDPASRHPFVTGFQPGTRDSAQGVHLLQGERLHLRPSENEYRRGVLPRLYSFSGQTTTGR